MKIVHLSLLLAILYVLMSLPDVYIYIDRYVPRTYMRFTYDNCPGIPTVKGMVAMGVVFFGITYVILYTKLEVSEKIENDESSIPEIPSSSPLQIS